MLTTTLYLATPISLKESNSLAITRIFQVFSSLYRSCHISTSSLIKLCTNFKKIRKIRQFMAELFMV